jgi:gas vesicle protein
MITKKDILEAIGAETDDRFTSGMLIGIGVGAIVGSALAMLFAPKAGAEMRQMIGERGTEMIEKAKNKVGLGKNGGEQSSESREPIR